MAVVVIGASKSRKNAQGNLIWLEQLLLFLSDNMYVKENIFYWTDKKRDFSQDV